MSATAVKRRFLSLLEVAEWAGVSRSTVLRWEAAGTFPRRVRLGPNRVAWDLHALEAWADSREAAGERDGGDA
jgi:prophage regulatory protein